MPSAAGFSIVSENAALLHACMHAAYNYPAPRMRASGNWFCPSSVRHKVILKSGDSASITTSKREDNDEIRRILAYVYLVELKAVSFSAFSTFF